MKRVLGLDVGTKTIGVAISDELGITAQGLDTIHRNIKEPARDFQQIAQLVEQNDIETIVIGLPKNMDGTIGPSGKRSEQFADTLQSYVSCTIQMWDERLTTMAAERMLISADVRRSNRKKVIDKVAASIILQNYLDYARTR